MLGPARALSVRPSAASVSICASAERAANSGCASLQCVLNAAYALDAPAVSPAFNAGLTVRNGARTVRTVATSSNSGLSAGRCPTA